MYKLSLHDLKIRQSNPPSGSIAFSNDGKITLIGSYSKEHDSFTFTDITGTSPITSLDHGGNINVTRKTFTFFTPDDVVLEFSGITPANNAVDRNSALYIIDDEPCVRLEKTGEFISLKNGQATTSTTSERNILTDWRISWMLKGIEVVSLEEKQLSSPHEMDILIDIN